MAEKVEKYDVVIIGAGPAGIAAALWCDELGLGAVLIEGNPEPGGQLLWTHNPIRNYPGVEAENGRDLRDRFADQLYKRGSVVRNATCISVDLADRSLRLSDGSAIAATAVIIATGIRRRKLGVPGESEFTGRGVLESGAGSKDQVAGKRVVIVGGGDAAVENALILSETAEHVTVVHRRDRLAARGEFIDELKRRENISVMFNSQPTSISGHDHLEKVSIESGGSSRDLAADALLIRIGVDPNSELFAGQLELDEHGYIVVDSRCRTSIANVFAVGDIANPDSMSIATAIGTGATAAKACLESSVERRLEISKELNYLQKSEY